MVKLDLQPPGMDPIKPPPCETALPVASSMPETDGFVYGHAVKQPRSKPPNVEAMFKAAGIPGPKEGGLPHSLEWYRGAKARQAARAKEKEELLVVKHGHKQSWASILSASLEDCSYRADCIMKEPQPLGLLAELLARTAHERPQAVDRIEELRMRLLVADTEKERLNSALSNARDSLGVVEADVRRKRVEAEEEEEERLKELAIEKKHKAKAEKQLRRNEALLLGEEWDESDSSGSEDENKDAAAGEEDSEEDDASPPGATPPLDVPPANELRDIFGTGEPPTPGATRGGLARELPPIPDPPPPPPLI
uniref:Uncharacterized protein n=1 Tax=Alexandrium catenella TaxID=2925 RepID=A0A7S1Q383_ALECA